jgi:5-methyltetrahydropteroyltriglutamate--homocysteine methyltransferase
MFTISTRGGYPRNPEPPRPAIIERAITEFQSGVISSEDLERAYQRGMVEVIAELVAAGVEVAGDGQVRFNDPIRHIVQNLKGFRINDDNFEPVSVNLTDTTSSSYVVYERIEWRKPIFLDDYRFLMERSPIKIRPSIIGPFSIASSVDPGCYTGRKDALVADIAKALNREMIGLTESGAKHILIEEPLLTSEPDAKLFFENSDVLCNDVTSSVTLALAGNATGIADKLYNAPFSGFAIDLMDAEQNRDWISQDDRLKDKILELGLVSANNARIESAMEIALGLIKYSGSHDPDLIWAAPGGGLKSLPRETAFTKLTHLCQGVDWARHELARREQPGGHL